MRNNFRSITVRYRALEQDKKAFNILIKRVEVTFVSDMLNVHAIGFLSFTLNILLRIITLTTNCIKIIPYGYVIFFKNIRQYFSKKRFLFMVR